RLFRALVRRDRSSVDRGQTAPRGFLTGPGSTVDLHLEVAATGTGAVECPPVVGNRRTFARLLDPAECADILRDHKGVTGLRATPPQFAPPSPLERPRRSLPERSRAAMPDTT